MKLDKTLSIVAAAALALTLSVGGWVLQMDARALLTQAEEQEIDATSLVLATAMDQAATLSATHAESLARDPAIITHLKSSDRAGLQAYARPIFEQLRTLGGVDVLHFHSADMHSFLRVWEPENFGQDLSRFRPMIVAANHDRRVRKGLELGVRGLSLRAVSAVTEGENLIGTVEVGVDLKSLTELSKAATGADYALFLDAAAGITDKGEPSQETGLKIEASTDAGLFQTLQQTGSIRLSRAAYLDKAKIDGRTLGIMGRPLLDFSGRMIGTIVVTRDFTGLEGHLSRSLVTIAAVAIVGFLVTFSIIMVTLRSLVLRPLETLAEQVKANAANKAEILSSLPEFRALQSAVAEQRNGEQPS
ncbi:cache domain-containing protein [Shinella sp. M27]|uniref:cache domain-containing protein n=1 Tax=Shinella sp. M27 TaxID=3368614 RepID=UPI003B9F7FA5